MSPLREYLRLAGKGDRKVAAVFAVSAEAAARAVQHARKGVPDLPVWLFSAEQPAPAVAAECERVRVADDSMALLVEAEKDLWPCWVALSVATWTGSRGCWPLKLAPFLVPPFRALVLNEHGDFFDATAAAMGRHALRRLRDGAHSAWNRWLDLQRGAALWLFALVAQRFAFFSRRLFRARHGSQPLEVAVRASAGDGVLTIRHARRHWNWAEVDRRLRESTERWALFLEGDAEVLNRFWGSQPLADARGSETLAERLPSRDRKGAEFAGEQAESLSPDDWLPLFEDARTFAVSRQADYRDWKEGLFATAPFRALQAGEASRTLAPVSTAILVDRAKLVALGLPKTVVPGTAWLLLFWKAAAAGWRSYSVGSGAKLAESPDWPYEEAEFVTRVLSDAGLRALGPREPDLARGSIGFAAGAARPFRGLPRVLIVSPYLPFPLSHGGAVRIYNLCRELSGRVDFVLACFREKEDAIEYEKLHEVFREVYVVDREERASKDASLPRQVREHASRSMAALIAAVCREKRMDLVQVEYTHLAGFREAAPDVPAILVEHDLTFTLYRQYAERTPTRPAREEADRWLEFERHWLRRYDGVWTMSGDDREKAIAEGSPAERTWAVANGVDVERFQPQARPASARPEVFYVGSFRHLPNILGFEKLRQEVMPRVWQRVPDARLRVVAGPEPERYWREFQSSDYPRNLDPRIEMHAFVSDLRPLYASASVVAVPLLVSAGTNIKVMEAMACGCAVVSTPIGCAGLGLVEGEDAVIREDFDEFSDAIVKLLEDQCKRARIEAAARRTVEQRFSWAAIAEEAYASYCRVWKAPAP